MSDLETRIQNLPPEQRAQLREKLRARRLTDGGHASIPRRPVDAGPAPLSLTQQGIWFLEQLQPGTPTHNGARAFRLRGPLDREALRAALAAIVARHESLRTVFRLDGREPCQVVLEDWSLELPLLDLALPPDRAEQAVAELLRERAREPFDLERDLLLRSSLVRLGPDDHVLLVRLHHIAFDAFSDHVFFRELSELYSALRDGREPTLPLLPIQYGDFAVWQRERLRGEALDRLLDYWKRELAGACPLLPLPLDRSRPPTQRHVGSHHRFTLPEQLSGAVIELGRGERTTVFMTLLAAFHTLLYRVTGSTDVPVGSPIAARVVPELENLIGFFSNTIVLRGQLEGNPTFREVLRRTRRIAVDAYTHQELPFDRVVEALRVARDPSYNPLFQVNFRAHSADARAAFELPGIEVERLTIDIGFSRFDLALELEVRQDAISGYVEYDHDLFDATTAAAVASDFQTVLEDVLADPDRPVLTIIPDARRRRRTSDRNVAGGIPRLRIPARTKR